MKDYYQKVVKTMSTDYIMVNQSRSITVPSDAYNTHVTFSYQSIASKYPLNPSAPLPAVNAQTLMSTGLFYKTFGTLFSPQVEPCP